MTFREAVDALAQPLGHKEIAAEWGLSVQSIRQARLDPQSAGYRAPPSDWRSGLAKLARERARELVQLAEELEEGRETGRGGE